MCRRSHYGVMQPGQHVSVEPFRYELNHSDVVHPCVRYIADGYLGHTWWLVYTPYYHSDASLEQPVLCYADGNDAEIPPMEWKTYCLVNDKIEGGYNSDPNLLFTGGVLYVYWRENYDDQKDSHFRATYVAKVTQTGIKKIGNTPVVWTDDSEVDAETCPTFMSSFSIKDSFTCYAMHLRFHSKHIKRMRQPWRRLTEKAVLVSDLIGLYSQQKHYGIAEWEGDAPDRPFRYVKTVRFRNCNTLYRPWHMDFFDYSDRRYAIVQTNMSNADLCLAESTDGNTFTFFRRPLITNKTIGKVGIYKPCAGVTPKGMFYLYYTAQDLNNRSQNRLYLTQMPFTELIEKIK